MTKQGFEDLLDKLYLHNRVLRENRVFLPQRVSQTVQHLFLHPEIGMEEERDAIRFQLGKLTDDGIFEFEADR